MAAKRWSKTRKVAIFGVACVVVGLTWNRVLDWYVQRSYFPWHADYFPYQPPIWLYFAGAAISFAATLFGLLRKIWRYVQSWRMKKLCPGT
jgi:hypothetical protein